MVKRIIVGLTLSGMTLGLAGACSGDPGAGAGAAARQLRKADAYAAWCGGRVTDRASQHGGPYVVSCDK
jgi:hypothetical protein